MVGVTVLTAWFIFDFLFLTELIFCLHNKDGVLEETEVKNVSRWAFGQSAEEAGETWLDMLRKMDTNSDSKISKDEYREYWLSKVKGKIQPDGTFVGGE
jgi:hypothetical protein